MDAQGMIDFFVFMGLVCGYAILAMLAIGVVLAAYFFGLWAVYAIRARRRHARYLTPYQKRNNLVSHPRVDRIVRGGEWTVR